MGVVAGALVTATSLAAGAAYAGPEIVALFSVKGVCSNGIASVSTTGATKCVVPYTTFSTAGTHIYKVPTGATSLHVRMWGGGGGGGDGGGTNGASGGQGSNLEFWLPVTAGSTVTFNVGSGGTAATFSNPSAGSGGATTATYKLHLVATAPGGSGGQTGQYCPSAPLGGAGGAPGLASSPALALTATAGATGNNAVPTSCPATNAPQNPGGSAGLPGAGGYGAADNTSHYTDGGPGNPGFVFISFQ